MRQMVTKTRPLVDFQQQIGQVDLRQTATDLFCQGLHTLGDVLTFILRHDQFPLLNPDPLALVQQTVDTREQVGQGLRAIAQTHGTCRVEVELLTNVLSEMRPGDSGNQKRLRVRITTTMGKIDVTGTQGITQSRQHAELIGRPSGLAVRHHKPSPRVWNKVDWCIVWKLAPPGRVQSTEHGNTFQDGVVILMRGEG
jgi:hypothetical protein